MIRSLLAHWRAAIVVFGLHSTLLALFTAGYLTSHDPNRGFLWLLPYAADMPSSLLSERLIGMDPSLTHHVTTYLLLGGLQWSAIGLLLAAGYKSIKHPSPRIRRNT
jgi:hypothetical protein